MSFETPPPRKLYDRAAKSVGDYSAVVDGEPHGRRRKVFQSGSKMGVGRWWVTDTAMNGDLFEASGGNLWEVVWRGDDQPSQAR